MTHAFRQHVTIQPGGRIELSSPNLPTGGEAEVIVLYNQQSKNDAALFGALSEDGELLEEIVREAYELRNEPLRHERD